MTADQAAADAADVDRFLRAIYARYGHDLRGYAPASIRRRVHVAVSNAGLADVRELEHAAVADPALFARVLTSLTVRVTEMFRDPAFYAAFRAEVVPLLRTCPRLNVWSAGCASGEETYSLAILLADEGLYDRCQLYATDLSADAVEQAKHGVYTEAAMTAFEHNYRAAGGAGDLGRHCTAAYGRVAIRQSLRRNILFFQHDLAGDHVFAEMDVVFCRNVMIYFGRDLRRRVFQKLADSVRPGGFLGLGQSERLSPSRRALFSELVPDQPLYKRSPAAA